MVLFNHWFIPYKVERGRLFFRCGTLQAKNDYKCNTWSRQKLSPQLTKLVVFFNRWFMPYKVEREMPNQWYSSTIGSCVIRQKEEDFLSNVRLSKPKMTTSATLGLGKNCPHNIYTKKILIVQRLLNKRQIIIQMSMHKKI